MARTYNGHALFIPDDIYEGIKKKKATDRSRFTARMKSVNAYICEILDEFVRSQDEASDKTVNEVHPLSAKRISRTHDQRKTA